MVVDFLEIRKANKNWQIIFVIQNKSRWWLISNRWCWFIQRKCQLWERWLEEGSMKSIILCRSFRRKAQFMMKSLDRGPNSTRWSQDPRKFLIWFKKPQVVWQKSSKAYVILLEIAMAKARKTPFKNLFPWSSEFKYWTTEASWNWGSLAFDGGCCLKL